LHEVTTPAAIRKDLEYYEPRVGEGPAMTQAIFSILYERLGQPDKALTILKQGYTPNLRPPFGVIAETATGTNPISPPAPAECSRPSSMASAVSRSPRMASSSCQPASPPAGTPS